MAIDTLSKPYPLKVLYTDIDGPSLLSRPYGLIFEYEVSLTGTQYIITDGFVANNFGTPKLIYTQLINPTGVFFGDFGNADIVNKSQQILLSGFESSEFGSPLTYNLKQFVVLQGDDQSLYGEPYIQDSVKHVYLTGADSLRIGDVSINNSTPELFPTSFNTHAVGLPAIGYRIRQVAPIGFDRLLLGEPTATKIPELFPSNFQSSIFGDASITHRIRYLDHYSKEYTEYGTPIVWFRTRYANPQSWQSSVVGDDSTVTHGVREVVGQGFIQQEYGAPWVSRGVRLLEPVTISQGFFGNHFVGRHQDIKPYGYVATLFGTRIIPEIQALYPLGFTGVFGLALADLKTKYLKPKGYLSAGEQPAFRWGRQIVRNSIQYIIQDYAGDSGLVPPKWSEWTAIENRNKTIGAIGSFMQRFGYAQIDNNARLLEPKGLLATGFDKSMIAYRIRKLPLQGIEPPYMAGWHIIHNGARVIAPKGEVQSLFGIADIVKTRRYLDRIGRIESFESGTALVAYRIRTLDIEKRYSIAPPIIRLPTIDLHTKYVDFRGYETTKYGLASLSIHFRIITPRWTHNEKSGQPALRNVTPELLTKGHDSKEFGNTSIRTQWRDVYAQGDDGSSIGLLKISDTKQSIDVRGFIDSLASQQHTVTKTGSAPYSLQYIWLHDEDGGNQGNGYGIAPPNIANPALNQNVLYHYGHRSSDFGVTFIWSNNLKIDSGIAIDGVSKALTVSNKNNVLSVIGIDSRIACGRPRLSPHTIYSVMDSTQQARDNQPAIGALHYVGEVDGGHGSSRAGYPSVESTIRNIYPVAVRSETEFSIGRPLLDLSEKHIKCEGFRRSRFGIPSIPFTLQGITLRTGISTEYFGATVITRPPYTGPQTIAPIDIYSTIFGQVYSDNFIRTLHANGGDSLSMGQSKDGDTPFMWQGLRVGENVPLIIGGGDMSSYGDASISLRVREVGAKGFNAFMSQYDISAFDGRMIVINADKKLPIRSVISVSSIEVNSVVGYQDIKLGQHFIRPDGNSDQYRKGGYHA